MAKNKKELGAASATFKGDLEKLDKALQAAQIRATVRYQVSVYGGEKQGDPGVEVEETFVMDMDAKSVLTEALRSVIISRQRALRTSGKVGGDEEAVYDRIKAHCALVKDDDTGEMVPPEVLASEAGESPWLDGKRGPTNPVTAAQRAIAKGYEPTEEEKEQLRKLLGL